MLGDIVTELGGGGIKMETIGFMAKVSNIDDISRFNCDLIIQAHRYNYNLFFDTIDLNLEIEEGLATFMDKKGTNILVLIFQPSDDDILYSSSKIIVELQEAIWNKGKSKIQYFFQDLIKLAHSYSLEECHVFFAFEWHRSDLIRYENGHLDDLMDYLKRDNGWYRRLYDVLNNSEYLDIDTPFIFKLFPASRDLQSSLKE